MNGGVAYHDPFPFSFCHICCVSHPLCSQTCGRSVGLGLVLVLVLVLVPELRLRLGLWFGLGCWGSGCGTRVGAGS